MLNTRHQIAFTQYLSLGILIAATALLAGCIRTTPRVVKIGLVAPFEGRYREIGDEVIPAARLAIRDYAAQADRADVSIDLVAYDDAGDPEEAADQARRVVIDPEVVIVIGHWRNSTTLAALPVYREAGLPLITFSTEDLGEAEQIFNLAPSMSQMEEVTENWLTTQRLRGILLLEGQGDLVTSANQVEKEALPPGNILMGGPDWGLGQFYALSGQAANGTYFVTGAAEPGNRHTEYWTDERTIQFVAGFETTSLGTPPGLLSLTAYEATWLAISVATGSHIEASPVDATDFEHGRRHNASIYLYQWQDGERRFVEQLH